MRPQPLHERILLALRLGAMSAYELGKALWVSHVTVRRELSLLREAGLVREGESVRGGRGPRVSAPGRAVVRFQLTEAPR
jgi:DNA-binding transcriptional ArsR family regulator